MNLENLSDGNVISATKLLVETRNQLNEISADKTLQLECYV